MKRRDEEPLWTALWREAILATTLGWNLAVPIVGGVLLGYALDRWLKTGHVFTLGLLVLGVVVAYYNLARFIRRIDRLDKMKQEEKEEQQ